MWWCWECRGHFGGLILVVFLFVVCGRVMLFVAWSCDGVSCPVLSSGGRDGQQIATVCLLSPRGPQLSGRNPPVQKPTPQQHQLSLSVQRPVQHKHKHSVRTGTRQARCKTWKTRQDKPDPKKRGGAPLLLTSPAFPRWPDHTLRLAGRATTSTSARANQHPSSRPTQTAAVQCSKLQYNLNHNRDG